MVLENFTYYIGKKKKQIKVKRVSVYSSGLMFRKRSFALLWELPKEREFSITSLFCYPFTAYWLDSKKRAVKIVDVKTWKLMIPGIGKYLLEIPSGLLGNDKNA